MVGDAPDGLTRFRLLASAIAGRPVSVATAAAGDGTWTDGSTVFVDAGQPGNHVQSIAVQASLLGAGSLDAEVLRSLGHRPTLARRYLALEGNRALAAHDALLPESLRALIDVAAAKRVDSPAASLRLANTRAQVADPPTWFGTIRPRHVRAAATAADGQVVAPSVEQLPRRATDAQLLELDDADEADDVGLPDTLSSPGGGGGPIGRLLARMLTTARSTAGGPPGADNPTHTSTRAARRGHSIAASITNAAPPDGVGMIERGSTRYPEWDAPRHRYRPDWCTVNEVTPKREGFAAFTPDDGQMLRRALARLGVGLDRRHRQLQGEDIDIDAAVEARVETLAGSAPDEAVYIDSVRRRRDLSVMVLLDISG